MKGFKNMCKEYINGWKYIVWVGGVDDYYKNYKDAKRDADEWKAKTNAIYDAVVPLLNNLQANEDKEYIYWPNRSVKIDSFKLKLQQLLND